MNSGQMGYKKDEVQHHFTVQLTNKNATTMYGSVSAVHICGWNGQDITHVQVRYIKGLQTLSLDTELIAVVSS